MIHPFQFGSGINSIFTTIHTLKFWFFSLFSCHCSSAALASAHGELETQLSIQNPSSQFSTMNCSSNSQSLIYVLFMHNLHSFNICFYVFYIWFIVFYVFSIVRTVSGEVPEDPVVSMKSGLIFEKRLIERHISVSFFITLCVFSAWKYFHGDFFFFCGSCFVLLILVIKVNFEVKKV